MIFLIPLYFCAGRVLGQKQRNRFAQSTHARAWLARRMQVPEVRKGLQYTLNATSTPPRAGTTGNEDYDEVHEEEENDDDDDDVDDDDVDDDGDDFDDDDDINSFSVSAEAWVITKKTAMNFR